MLHCVHVSMIVCVCVYVCLLPPLVYAFDRFNRNGYRLLGNDRLHCVHVSMIMCVCVCVCV